MADILISAFDLPWGKELLPLVQNVQVYVVRVGFLHNITPSVATDPTVISMYIVKQTKLGFYTFYNHFKYAWL